MRSGLLASASLLVLAIAGCGATVEAPPAPVGGAQALNAACASLYASYVTWAKACTGLTPPPAEIEDLVASCAQRAALPGLPAAGVAIQSCSAKVAASSCAALPLECIMSRPGYEDERGSLTEVVSSVVEGGNFYDLFPRLKGTLALGLGCQLSSQCSSGTCGSDGGCGVCVDMKRPGDACGATALCVRGSACKAGICVDTGKPAGAMCSAPKGELVCQLDLYCAGAVCAKRVAVGGACTGQVSRECVDGAICDASICQAVTEGHAGEACDAIAAGCVEGTFCQDGHCHVPVAGVPLHGACGVDVCAAGLNCDHGCVPPLNEGATCDYYEECGGGRYCLNMGYHGTCVAPVPEGEVCGAKSCEIGLFCDAATQRCRRELAEGAACGDDVRCRPPFTCSDGICGVTMCTAG